MIKSLVGRASRLLATMEGASKPKVVFVLGGPGAGKGTQCGKIVEKYNFIHLSAGDLLRAERNTPGTAYGELIEEHIQNGTIVPVEITCKLIENAMVASGSDKFLIDGFPRNKNNLDGWEKTMKDKVDLLFVLHFRCTEDVCIKRCLQRGREGSGRSDDNKESLVKRIRTFVFDSLPIIELYESKNMVKTVDADQSEGKVFEDVQAIFDQIQ